MRVSMSAIGSFIVSISIQLLPASSSNSRNSSLLRQFTEADSTHVKITHIPAVTTTPPAAVNLPGGILRFSIRLNDLRFLSHNYAFAFSSFLNGTPSSSNMRNPCSRFWVVVVTDTSRPCSASTSSELISGNTMCSLKPMFKLPC